MIVLHCRFHGLKVGKGTNFVGFPLIRRYPNTTISLGENCDFNSAKNSVLVGINSPCKFITLSENAEINIGNNVGASGTLFVSAATITIGNNVMFGANSSVVDTDFHSSDPELRSKSGSQIPARPIKIEDNVFIGYNCLILKGVTVGKNSVIGANSVVFNSIPKNSIAAGNPCKIVIRKNW